MEVAMTKGTDASTRIIENFIPIKEASNNPIKINAQRKILSISMEKL